MKHTQLCNRMVEGVEVAPAGCVVCHKPKPDTEADATGQWSYLAGSTPVGALACSPSCLDTAVKRWKRSGRVDTPEMRAKEIQ